MTTLANIMMVGVLVGLGIAIITLVLDLKKTSKII
jgi:hypothetical protein